MANKDTKIQKIGIDKTTLEAAYLTPKGLTFSDVSRFYVDDGVEQLIFELTETVAASIDKPVP